MKKILIYTLTPLLALFATNAFCGASDTYSIKSITSTTYTDDTQDTKANTLLICVNPEDIDESLTKYSYGGISITKGYSKWNTPQYNKPLPQKYEIENDGRYFSWSSEDSRPYFIEIYTLKGNYEKNLKTNKPKSLTYCLKDKDAFVYGNGPTDTDTVTKQDLACANVCGYTLPTSS